MSSGPSSSNRPSRSLSVGSLPERLLWGVLGASNHHCRPSGFTMGRMWKTRSSTSSVMAGSSPWRSSSSQARYTAASAPCTSLPWMLPSIHMAHLASWGPVAGLAMVSSGMGRPSTLVPMKSSVARSGRLSARRRHRSTMPS